VIRSDINRAVLDALSDNGDALNQVRDITHWAYFPSAQARAGFIERAVAAGLKLVTTMEPRNARDKFGAILLWKDIPEQNSMDRITAMLAELAEQCGGDYDGWETQVL